jgi:hypothetical protein
MGARATKGCAQAFGGIHRYCGTKPRLEASIACSILEQSFATGRAYGASGTPSGLLIDKEGKVASQVALGAPAVLALLSTALDTAQSGIVKASQNEGAVA